MGNEIVYCVRCATRLLASDFEGGKAVRHQDKHYCAACLREFAASLPPEEAQNLLDQLKRKRGSDPAIEGPPRRPPPRKNSTVRIPVVGGERRADIPESSAAVPIAVGIAVLLILGGLAAALSGSSSSVRRPTETSRGAAPIVDAPRVEPAPVRPAPPPEPPPENPAIRREESARRALEKARAYGRANAADLPGRIAAFEEAAWECRGTSLAADARREHEALQKQRGEQVAAELAPLADKAARSASEGKYAEAIGLLQRERSRVAGADWTSAIDQKILQVREGADRAFAELKPKALQSRRRGEEKNVKAAVDRVASWGLEDLTTDLTAALDAEPPPARPVDPEVRAYMDAWDAAFGLARVRDYAGAVRKLEAAAASIKDPAAKAESAADLDALRALAAAFADVQGLLRAAKGQKVSLEVETGVAPVRIDGVVSRVGPTWLEVKTDGDVVSIEPDDLTAGSLRELLGKTPGRKPDSDARVGILFPLLEGEGVDLKAVAPGSISPRILAFAARVAQERMRPDVSAKENEARTRFEAAERQFADPATRMESFEVYHVLQASYAECTVVRRKRAVLTQRLEAEKEAGNEYIVLADQMRAAGSFRRDNLPKVGPCWTSTADLPPERENYVEWAFTAKPGIEYRCWAYVGACCAETFAFDMQGTDMGADPGTGSRIPVKNTILFLKKTHVQHGGRKEPTRFEWVQIPLTKYPAAGRKVVRLLSGQQGFSVAVAIVSTTRTGPPSDAQMKEWDKARPGMTVAMSGVDPALVGWWTLDEGSGTRAADSSPSRLAGVLRNNPVWTAGKRRGALSFDGLRDYVEIPKDPKLYIPGPFTVAAWLNPAGLPKSEWGMYALSDYNAEGDACTFSLRVMSTGAVQFFWQTEREERSIAISSGHLAPGTWYHVAGVWDGMMRTIYINGVPDGVNKDPQRRPDTGANTAIGRPGAANLLYFNGRIDDVRIYSRALSSSEVRTLVGR